MKLSRLHFLRTPSVFLACCLSVCWSLPVALYSATPAAFTRGADTGTLTGTVSNAATSNSLEGARVELPKLGLTALTDNTGRFVLAVPAGVHEVVVTYIGLDAMRGEVTVASGQRAVRDFDLTTGIYMLQAFKVTGEREGDALALTAQRNADNVKNIVAMDSYGNLP